MPNIAPKNAIKQAVFYQEAADDVHKHEEGQRKTVHITPLRNN